ncbi:hypothetical protein [Celeribacter sp. SCSIO 80788]|uniref:hypothetical protein n=1 Tax=Celeribacter sp. SCSIO 80788 TaxID=3117013 RepID=UPI003DA33CE9
MTLARQTIWAQLALRGIWFPMLVAFISMGRASVLPLAFLLIDTALLVWMLFALRRPAMWAMLLTGALSLLHYLHAISGGLALSNALGLLDGVLACVVLTALALRNRHHGVTA